MVYKTHLQKDKKNISQLDGPICRSIRLIDRGDFNLSQEVGMFTFNGSSLYPLAYIIYCQHKQARAPWFDMLKCRATSY